ncbi:MAG: thiamine phosphate synthase [Nitrospira sp.]|nr:thiamine phosphate synthase [Nitrospira sp.]
MGITVFHPPIYLITDRHQTRGRPLSEVVEGALKGGVRFVQLREKDLSTRELLSLAQDIRRLTAKVPSRLLINDRIDICLAVKADGVHLRSNSLPTRIARRILGDSKLIGVSTHSLEEAQLAEEEGADFITLGPIYETPSKAGYGPPLGLDVLRAVRRRIKIPVLALGGIQKERIHEVLDAGANGIALISAILMAENPRQSAIDLINELNRGRSNHQK